MQAKRTDRMVRAERIPFFQVYRESKAEYNPQEDATNYLLEISNQEYDYIDQENFSNTRQQPQVSSRMSKLRARIPVAQNFTKSHRNWRKNSVNFLSGQEVCVMRKERVVNLSNFLIFENDDLRGNLPESRIKLEQLDSPRPKNSKMLINFMRKRNLNYQKLQVDLQEGGSNRGWKRVGSPIQRINQSCELKREKEEPTRQLTRQLSNRAESSTSCADFRATSPNFRNKKVINYFKYRLSRNPEPSHC